MFRFLDALYVTCCNFYKRREPNMYRISGLILLATVFGCNVVFVTLILPYYYEDVSSIQIYRFRYYIVITTMAILLGSLYIRYFKVTNYEDVKFNLDSIHAPYRNILYLLSVLYIILSFITMLGYAVYLGYNK